MQTYIIVKPDGIPLLDDIVFELQDHDIALENMFKVDRFDTLSIPLYLDPDAIERGNAPIIIGINNIFRQYYGTAAVVLLLSSMRAETREDFIVRVCRLKKELRARYLGGYTEYQGRITDQDYIDYDVPFSERLAAKRCISCDHGYIYSFQINGIHSPDDITAYKREIQVLKEYGAFDNPIRTSLYGGD